MSLWKLTGFGNRLRAFLFLLAAAISIGHAQDIEVEQNAPLAGENATQQIGGAGYSDYSFVGALRCSQNVAVNGLFVKRTDAIVGVKIRKGTLVDYMQVECAPLVRDTRGAFVWQQASIYLGGWAGNSTGGNMGRYTVCPLGYVISGFKAIYSGGNSYLSDIRFMCSPIAGAGMYSSPLGMQRYFQIRTTDSRQWISWFSDDTAIRSYSLGYNRYAIAKQVPDTINFAPKGSIVPQSQCSGGAAALSVAVGTYISLTGLHSVVQAFQMFCYGGSTDTTMADPYLNPFQNGQ